MELINNSLIVNMKKATPEERLNVATIFRKNYEQYIELSVDTEHTDYCSVTERWKNYRPMSDNKKIVSAKKFIHDHKRGRLPKKSSDVDKEIEKLEQRIYELKLLKDSFRVPIEIKIKV